LGLFSFSYTQGVQETYRDFLDSRCNRAMAIGFVVYLANIIEPWQRFHENSHVREAVQVQFAAALLIGLLFLSSLTKLGKRHKLALLVVGLLIGTAGFEAVVCLVGAFNTEYSDGFPILFAYYSLFIPTTVFATGLVGVAIFLVLAIPEAILGHQSFPGMMLSNATGFVIFLSGRYIANSLWQRQAAAKERELAFVSGLHHEFSNSLSTLCMTAEQLRAGKAADPTAQAEAYRILDEESNRLREDVTRLYDFGRTEAGVGLEFDTIDPVVLVQDVVNSLQKNQGSGGHHIYLKSDSNVPQTTGDVATLRVVVRNLVRNAIKYSPAGRQVSVTVTSKKKRAVIRVSDEGCGIKKEEQEHIFDLFFRGTNPSAKRIPGSGIGLALVKAILNKHKAKIHLQSEEKRGSVFTITLPRVK
jgi:signal transduction histidine kinase